MYDYLIVGAGLYGAVFARQAMDAGKSVLMIDKRSHIAGNIYTDDVEGTLMARHRVKRPAISMEGGTNKLILRSGPPRRRLFSPLNKS